ncbi:Tetratricopeptide repeat protein 37 [Echinococcus granulosus]|uniref:Tetratricopeptide repeat protein 37 n=1 Tax=Echinococcus granulosus TaxID=6210 RepID=W6UMM8_ECHGR|nr:Tetratricopeptide repeat protein 37 [Echinococcus granulosus]EUB59387.1 Tetratricopeptide repeat protein 37 [Echinococcus granulosus]
MNVNTKAVTRKAKELFQQKSFDACLKELQPILDGEGGKNIACLLLASACYDNLGKEDKAVDTVYKVLSLDNKNPTAWHLPPGLPQLRESCSLVLASDNADSFALEAILPFSEDEKIFGCFTVSFTGLNEKQTDLILLKTYTERLSSCVDSGSDTAYFTLALAESFLETCQALNEGYFDDLRQPFVRLQELSVRGLKVGERWHRQGFLDVHISALSAIIAYALNDFIRCDFILRDLMDFCRSSYAQVAKDITQFTTFPNAPPSTLTDFLTPRLLYTPVRLFGDSLPQDQTPLHRVFGWAGCLLLSNAAKSNFRHLLVPSISLYSTECLGAKEKLTWPLPQAVLFTECCLLIDDTTNLQHFVNFSSSPSGLLESYSVEEDAYEVYKKTDHKLFTPAMCLNYGLVALHLKKLTECVPALQRAVRSQPMNPLVWEILGESYMARGSFGIALQSLEKAIQLDSNRLMSHILYAQACTALSDYSTALTAYSRVVELLKHQKLHSLSLLANKGLIELNVKLAAQDLNSGMRTTAIHYIETALSYGSRMLSLFLKSSTDAAVGRETLLAWICLGLLELSRANYTQTGDEGEVARPLFGKFMCFTKASQRYLLQSEACFLRALQVCKQLQPGNDQLAALAWFGMGSVLALGGVFTRRRLSCVETPGNKSKTGCINACPFLPSSPANRCLQDARRVLDVCQRKDFQHHGYWLVMAQLASVNSQQTASVTKFGEPGETQYLLQSVSCGFNLDAMWHILPRVFQSFKRSSTTEASGYDEESIKWSRLTAAEYLNRCLGKSPESRLRPFLSSSAYDLLSVFTPTDYERLTVKAHYFLSSCSQGKLDQSLCEEFQALAADSPVGCGVCAATALANLFKGNSDATRNSLVRAYRAAGMEVTLGSLSCLAPALLHAALPSEVEGLWEELSSFSVDPIRRLVIAEGLHVKPPSLALHHLSAFLSHPSYGYEYFLFQFRNSSTTEHIRHLLTLSKTWALLRPDSEPVWTLLAATLRLYSRLQGVKPKSRVAAREGAVASLLSAFTVRSPDPTSETFAVKLDWFHFAQFQD